MAGLEIEILRTGSCGPLSVSEPSFVPQIGATTYQLRAVRRIDVSIRARGSEWCVAGVRSYDRGVEIVGRIRGAPDRSLPWGHFGGGGIREWIWSPIELVTESGVVLGQTHVRDRGGDVRTFLFFAPGIGSPAIPPTFTDAPEAPNWRAAFDAAKVLVLRARPIRVVEGPVELPPIPARDGPVASRTVMQGIDIRLIDLRISPRIAVAWEPRAQRPLTLDERPVLELQWGDARDDLGNSYAPGDLFRQYVMPDAEFYQSFGPLQAGATALRFTVRRAVVLADTEWQVRLPLH
jgi:hypothetical protein